MEMQDFDNQREKSFEEWHQLENRGNYISFQQGMEDRKIYNETLMAFELDHHKNRAEAVLCLKVSVVLLHK